MGGWVLIRIVLIVLTVSDYVGWWLPARHRFTSQRATAPINIYRWVYKVYFRFCNIPIPPPSNVFVQVVLSDDIVISVRNTMRALDVSCDTLSDCNVDGLCGGCHVVIRVAGAVCTPATRTVRCSLPSPDRVFVRVDESE